MGLKIVIIVAIWSFGILVTRNIKISLCSYLIMQFSKHFFSILLMLLFFILSQLFFHIKIEFAQ